MIILALLGLTFVLFASTCAVSLNEFSRHRLEEICQRWGTEKRLGQIIKNYERMGVAAETGRVIAAVVTCVSGVYYLFPRLTQIRLDAAESPISYWLEWCGLVLLGTILMMLVVVWIPSAIAQLWSSSIVFYTSPLWSLATRLFFPLELVHRFFRLFFFRLAGYRPGTSDEELFEEEIRTIVTEGHREGLLEEDAREMIESVIELGDVSVSEIMTPRTDMLCIPKSLSWEEMLAQIVTIPHSRIPVFDENRDDMIGILFIKDLVPELTKRPEDRAPWTDLLRSPLFVPETKPVDKLLQEFQNVSQQGDHARIHGTLPHSRHMHVAIVLDEYGGVSGLVSLEDILEEIVGEIVDEHDPIEEKEEIQQLSPDVFEVLGKVHIDELNEHLNAKLPEEEDYDTIGGYIFSTLGHVPHVGESLSFAKENKRFKLTVLETTKRRIERVRIERIQDETVENGR